ncbi:hypothetical protein BDY24DRAFT_437326 [Mrakia frigida]|uniref:NYN domain-containing protein n=1 Tax=Mrakia frigida TaxID=29902 RepID=UPI003FCC1614
MQSLKSFVGAVGLEDAASHELDRLRWSFKEKEFELERKGWENERRVWEMERKRWEREREALLEALEREKRDREMREAAEGVKEERLAEVGVYWLADDGARDGSGLLSRIENVELVGQIREMALGYGNLRVLRAYSSATASALARLDALGVELRSCLGREGTSSVVHQVVLDAMLFATSSSNAQTTVFLITDNEEFVYLAAKLRMMGCNVIFICRSMDESKRSLRDVASGVYELDSLGVPLDSSSSSPVVDSTPPPLSNRTQPSSSNSSQDLYVDAAQQEVAQTKEETMRSRTPTLDVDASGIGSSVVSREEDRSVLVKEVVETSTGLDRSTNPDWEVASPPRPPKSTFDGEGWGVEAPSGHPAPKSTPIATSWPPPSHSTASTSSRTSQSHLSTSPTTTWASVAGAPPSAVHPPPPTSVLQHFPESHARPPTYIHAPSSSSVHPSGNQSASLVTPKHLSDLNPVNFTPLLQTIASFRPKHKRPFRSAAAAALLSDRRNFYREEGVKNWKEYTEAAGSEGLVELGGSTVPGQEWIALTKKGLDRISESAASSSWRNYRA